MIDLREIYWAAGFLEGEGSFFISSAQGTTTSAFQNEAEPLERLRRLFGGSIGKDRTGYIWRAYGPTSRGVMMTLYPLMTLRRKMQIRKVLVDWKMRPLRGDHRMRKDKAEILTKYDNGIRVVDLCKEYKMDSSTIHRWLNKRGRTKANMSAEEAHVLH